MPIAAFLQLTYSLKMIQKKTRGEGRWEVVGFYHRFWASQVCNIPMDILFDKYNNIWARNPLVRGSTGYFEAMQQRKNRPLCVYTTVKFAKLLLAGYVSLFTILCWPQGRHNQSLWLFSLRLQDILPKRKTLTCLVNGKVRQLKPLLFLWCGALPSGIYLKYPFAINS